MKGREDEAACRWASLAKQRPEEAAERDRGGPCSIVHLSLFYFLLLSFFFFYEKPAAQRGQRNISPPTRGGRKPET